MSVDPLGTKKLPSDDVPRQMLPLLVELLRSAELPELAIGGAWFAIICCLTGRPSLGPMAMELGLFDTYTRGSGDGTNIQHDSSVVIHAKRGGSIVLFICCDGASARWPSR